MSRTAVKGLIFNIAFQVVMLILFAVGGYFWSVAILFVVFVGIDVLMVWSSRRSHRYYQEWIAAFDEAYDRARRAQEN